MKNFHIRQQLPLICQQLLLCCQQLPLRGARGKLSTYALAPLFCSPPPLPRTHTRTCSDASAGLSLGGAFAAAPLPPKSFEMPPKRRCVTPGAASSWWPNAEAASDPWSSPAPSPLPPLPFPGLNVHSTAASPTRQRFSPGSASSDVGDIITVKSNITSRKMASSG
eukprot:357285-Chlamydomonas_euryale.AAC.2